MGLLDWTDAGAGKRRKARSTVGAEGSWPSWVALGASWEVWWSTWQHQDRIWVICSSCLLSLANIVRDPVAMETARFIVAPTPTLRVRRLQHYAEPTVSMAMIKNTFWFEACFATCCCPLDVTRDVRLSYARRFDRPKDVIAFLSAAIAATIPGAYIPKCSRQPQIIFI